MSAETQLEVFGTKEVSVKEFMGSSDKSLVLLSDYEKAKQNLLDLKEKHKARVEELVVVDKLSSDELKELNGIRAELREPRYLIQNIEKNNISVFEAYKKTDKANLKGLVEINVDLEDKATEKLQAEEKRKKEEKEAEAQAEEIRVAKIKSDIDNIETYCYQVIQKMTFETLKRDSELVDQSLNAENDFEEYDLLLDQVKDRVVKQLLEKTNDITARENQRLENEAMKQEIFQVRVNRLKEVGYNLVDDKFVSKEYSVTILKSDVLNGSSELFELELLDVKNLKEQAEQSKRDAELKKQKDEQFEVRKNRLAELYPNYNFDIPIFSFYGYTNKEIYEANIVTFETIITDAKKAIADAKEAEELALKQKEEADKKFAAEKKKADAENKARVKRLATDREKLFTSLSVGLGGFTFESENQEIVDFVKNANQQLQELKVNLLTQLNEL